MIKKVKINFPEFKLDKELEFKKWVNVVEQPNKWWKTTFINTIMSMYTWYFGRVKKVPTWFASIETDKGTFNLVKWNWIWSVMPDPLARYAMVGSFFNDTKSTVEQREILTKFLWVDYDWFINNYIDDYLKSMDESAQEYYKSLWLGLAKLKEDLKTAKNHEWIIIDDITRLKWETLAFKTQEFKDVEQFYLDQENVNSKIREHNLKQNKIIEDNNKVSVWILNDKILITKLESSLEAAQDELARLRTEYEEINSTVCFNCGSAMKIPEDKLKLIQAKWEDIKKELKNIKATLKLLKDKKYPEPKESNYLNDVVKACEVLKLKLPSIPEQRLIEYDNYKKQVSQLEIVKRELTIKEKQLSEINTVRLEDCIQIYTQATESFNKDLEVKVKTTGLNIELFKTLKNGNIESTFNIYSDDGTEYSMCSSWEKLVIQIKLALLFIKKFNFDFCLIDEWWIIGKDNFKLLCDMLKDYQVIFFKADKWSA